MSINSSCSALNIFLFNFICFVLLPFITNLSLNAASVSCVVISFNHICWCGYVNELVKGWTKHAMPCRQITHAMPCPSHAPIVPCPSRNSAW